MLDQVAPRRLERRRHHDLADVATPPVVLLQTRRWRSVSSARSAIGPPISAPSCSRRGVGPRQAVGAEVLAEHELQRRDRTCTSCGRRRRRSARWRTGGPWPRCRTGGRRRARGGRTPWPDATAAFSSARIPPGGGCRVPRCRCRVGDLALGARHRRLWWFVDSLCSSRSSSRCCLSAAPLPRSNRPRFPRAWPRSETRSPAPSTRAVRYGDHPIELVEHRDGAYGMASRATPSGSVCGNPAIRKKPSTTPCPAPRWPIGPNQAQTAVAQQVAAT